MLEAIIFSETAANLYHSMSRLVIINKAMVASRSSKKNICLKSSADQTEKQIWNQNMKSPDLWTIHLHHKSDLIVH